MRKLWLVGVLSVFGCQSIIAPKAPPAADRPAVAGLSEAGRTSPPEAPSGLTEASYKVTQPPAPEPADHLALAAKCVERGDQSTAATHLESYVRANPDQLMFRAHLAEILFKIDHTERAKFHFEKFAADAQTATGAAKAQLIHCHTRLMDLACRADDRHAEQLHRGIGLLLLVRDQDASAERDDEFREEMLCNAVRALTAAKELKPTDPRALVYLAEAHDRAGHRRAADTTRSAARSLALPGTLTAEEVRRVAIR